ncbi:adhesion G-protein coupled receptor D1-like isoform X2 [Pomacea canaliculata]|nr:adhesion G-protein coupled receptor D1-like isoform X2 [Pomacea canaliculata]
MAITVFTCLGSLTCERVCVHRNLCLAIASAQVTFLAGVDAVGERVVCSIVALLLHYCYLAVFTWMLVEGLHLYSQVVRVFGTEHLRVRYYVCFGWGIPLILVAISAATNWQGYGTPTSCWLSTQRKTIWAFVGPALAIIMVNLVILGIVVKIVAAASKLDKRSRFHHVRAGAKAALLLLPLLGLTWLFGLAAVNQDLVVFQYLFAIFNTLQGFFIFLFHCAFNTEVRQAFKRLQERRSLQRGDLSSSSGYSSSASMSPTPQTQEAKLMFKKPGIFYDCPGGCKINRIVPAGYTTTTTIASTTTASPATSGHQDGRCSNLSLDQKCKTEEMALMFI